MDGGGGELRNRDGLVLECAEAGREVLSKLCGGEQDSDRGISPASGLFRGEGWHVCELLALAAMEAGSPASSRRGEDRSGDHVADLSSSEGIVRDRRRDSSEAGAGDELGLCQSVESIARGSGPGSERARHFER